MSDSNKKIFAFLKIAFPIMIALLVIVVAIKVCTVGYDFGYRVFTEPAVSAEGKGRDVAVTVTKDMSGKEIGRVLESKGLIEDASLFNLQLKLSAYKDRIKPGEYVLNTSMTAKDMMVIMSTSLEESDEEDMTSGVSAADEEGSTEVEEE